MCNITLNQPTIAQQSGNNILKLRVSGIANDCPSFLRADPGGRPPINEIRVNLEISVIVNGQPDPNLVDSISASINDFIDPSGFQAVANSGIFQWMIETKLLPAFPCGSTVRIRASCHTDPNCFVEQDFVINCGECPNVELVLTDVADVCVDGKRTATFEVTLINPVSPSFYEIDFGDGDDEPIVFNGGQNPIPISHEYSGGNFIAIVTSNFPENCPSSNDVQVPIPFCEDNCPRILLELVSVSDCNPVTNKRTATFRITLTNVNNPPSSPCVYEFDFGDGESPNILFDNTTVSPFNITHEYDNAGNYSAILNCTVPVGCPDSNSVLVPVSVCNNCPSDVDFEIIDNNGNRFSVIDDNDGILEAVSNNPFHLQINCLPQGKYIIRVTSPNGAGLSFTWREDENPPVQTNSRDFNFTIANGTKSLNVVIQKDGCPPLSETVIIRACEDDCCPKLTGLTASCMPHCPPSTTVTLTAMGDHLDCAETFSWDFGDGNTAETNQPSTIHTYSQFGLFDAEVAMVRPEYCGSPRVQRSSTPVGPCPPSCLCAFLSIITAFLLLAFLSLMPMIACADPATKQALIITLIVVAILLSIFWLWWILDPCCKPTSCEMLRILFWVLSWALIVVGALAILQFCVSALPFGLFYGLLQQGILNRINAQNCRPGAPDIFSWPFQGCR
ncbi:MAG: hypothetical protein A2057_08055 [Ignavibacteria bacterium GWA2_35_9]|nr:MAG: hypothetical protein A2057_08055 [Ignavibacteria bacterium GWA2_35_9]OGU43746.1 MAG: hypothetical protein A2000_12195 [Ignavibacteria bacterium GWB2_36_8]OGU52485.1 MAG: hypothetical protein A2080_02955 [Ignavibacteria bacterium GWC2_36_12]